MKRIPIGRATGIIPSPLSHRTLTTETASTMKSWFTKGTWQAFCIWCMICVLTSGCIRNNRDFSLLDTWENAPSYHRSVATQIEYPNVGSNLAPEVANTPEPLKLQNPADLVAREITLDEAVQMALSSGDILRGLGGTIVSSGNAASNFDQALTESSAQGVEAALSAFDAQVGGQLFWQKNNRPNNTTFLIFQPVALEQTASQFNYELSKRTATGATFTARHNVFYDNNNSPARFFQSDFNGFLEASYRQPLMQGGGVTYNRIAGPNGGIGVYNGVLIARINADISLADFESGVINFVNDVETAYWNLYFAYHNLEAQVAGRNASLLTWQRVKELQDAGARGGDLAAEAEARSQFYNFDVQVTEGLTGAQGLYEQEQTLRYLLGLPPGDGSLLKPITEPMRGEVVYDWHSALADAITKRVEIRRQKWTIKRRELELCAARLNRKPTLDFLGIYRYRGLGDHLIGSRDANNSFESLYQNIFEGEYQEWQAGFELGYPVGLRAASAAVSNARWQLAKAQSVLQEQQLRVSHDLSTSSRAVTRAYQTTVQNFNRQASDRERVQALTERYEGGLDNINFLLQAQRSLATSQTAYYRSLVDYQLSIRDFHREKGSLLNYNQISLSEGSWPGAAYQDSVERGRFFAPRRNPSAVDVPNPVSKGSFDPMTVGMNTSPAMTIFEETTSDVIVDPPAEGEMDSTEEAASPSDADQPTVPEPADDAVTIR